ncbi:MAG: hypothetical protein J1F03_08270 [Oscillospiraceae bacterium]|nr:hypothetical protein [Oscillospiraceae bacterium]
MKNLEETKRLNASPGYKVCSTLLITLTIISMLLNGVITILYSKDIRILLGAYFFNYPFIIITPFFLAVAVLAAVCLVISAKAKSQSYKMIYAMIFAVAVIMTSVIAVCYLPDIFGGDTSYVKEDITLDGSPAAVITAYTPNSKSYKYDIYVCRTYGVFFKKIINSYGDIGEYEISYNEEKSRYELITYTEYNGKITDRHRAFDPD